MPICRLHFLIKADTNIKICFILNSEFNAYQKQINVISITSEMIVIDISLHFYCSVFWIISDFSIHLMHFTSEFQTPITFLFVNESIKCGYAFSYLEGYIYFGTKIILV